MFARHQQIEKKSMVSMKRMYQYLGIKVARITWMCAEFINFASEKAAK